MKNSSFPLLKYFSIISFVCILAVAIALSLFYRQQSIQQLISHGEESNVVLTQALYNTIWPHFHPFAEEASSLPPKDLAEHPYTQKVSALVKDTIESTPVLKVKIFNLNAKTIFSTDSNEFGVQKEASYPGSISARTGEVISVLSHRDVFSAITGILYNREVVSSYLPIRENVIGDDRIVGVFEVYFDVTERFQDIWKDQVTAFIIIMCTMFILYWSLFYFVMRADRVMTEQDKSLKESLDRIREQKEELRNTRDEAIDASKAKSIFLANMSHELRTPLNAIIGYSEMLYEEDYDFNDEVIADIKRINKSGRHLLSLINNILDLSKIEAGEIKVHIEEVRPVKIAYDVVSSLQSLIEEKGNFVRVAHGEVSRDELVNTDSVKLHQILYNLVGNANKFTDKGEIIVTIDMVKNPNKVSCLRIQVEDHGIGMTPEHAETLFEAFKQADDSTTRKYEGTGLGLAITKHLCELLGGSISAESEVGKGSVFTVVLPLNKPHVG